MSQKTFFIIPGFREQAKDAHYQWLIQFLKERRVRVIKTPVVWNYYTLSQNSQAFVRFYLQSRDNENYVLGFSFGSVIALLTANIIRPKKIFLCSLSPAFAEDKMHNKIWARYIGKRRVIDNQKRNGRKIAKNLQIPAVIFLGEVEANKSPQLERRSEETAKLAKRAKLIRVKNAPHQIGFPEYMDQIKKVLSKELDITLND